MTDEDTLRCGECESLFHRTANCPTLLRYEVREQTIRDEEVYGVVDKRTKELLPGTLTYDEATAKAMARKLNREALA